MAGGRKKGQSFRSTFFFGKIFGINWFVLSVAVSSAIYWYNWGDPPDDQK